MSKDYAAWAARWRVPLGFALGVAYLVWSRPTVTLLVAGGLVAFGGVLVRAAAAGHLDKNRSLSTDGPYRYTRNPLYLGSFVMGAGLAIAGDSWPLAAAFLILFSLVYWPVIRREERSLRKQFPGTYERYAASVPLFVPAFLPNDKAQRAGEKFRWERYRKNREYEAGLGYALTLLFLVLKMRLG